MTAQGNTQDQNPEILIQMGLMMRFSGIFTLIFMIIFIQIMEFPRFESIIIIIAAICGIPASYFMGNSMIKQGKEKLKESMRQQANEQDRD